MRDRALMNNREVVGGRNMFFPFAIMGSLFLIIVGILIGVSLIITSSLLSYSSNFWIYIKKISLQNTSATDALNIEELDKGRKLIETLSKLVKAMGIVIIVLCGIAPIWFVVSGVLSK
jgi:hypothetical protein